MDLRVLDKIGISTGINSVQESILRKFAVDGVDANRTTVDSATVLSAHWHEQVTILLAIEDGLNINVTAREGDVAWVN